MACFEIVFDSRGYELDGDGLVPVHVHLHYMEHLRWEYAARGLPEVAALFREGNAFVVVAQTLRIAGNIGLATSIRGTQWVGHTGNTSIGFHYTFHRVDDDVLLAAGSAAMVYLDRSGAPTPLPDCFGPRDPAPFAMPDLAPPEFPEVPLAPFERSYRVRTGDLDLMRHMNQANYAMLYDDTRQAAAHCNAYGPSGLGMGRIRFLHLEYLNSAQMGDELVAATWPIDSPACMLGFTLHRNDVLLGRAVIQI